MTNEHFEEALIPGVIEPKAKGSKPGRKPKAAGLNSDPTLNPGLPPNLGKPLKVEVPDFADPNRPKTCLEVDFPLVPINALSALEGNAGKPIYQMSKWWARRRSCVFRAMLLAAATKAPIRHHPDGQPMLGSDGNPLVDEDATANAVWDAYYANHQAAGNFRNLKVLDPFMGGGTTLVEGSRLGLQVEGVDLNPVAWFIVKNELACTDPAEVKAFFDQIEAEVKPLIQPFYATEGVGGIKGRWFKNEPSASPEAMLTETAMPESFDPISLPLEERMEYRYEGPEVIYTFWAKHGSCPKPGCHHRTPIFRSPVVATKRLGVKYLQCTCKQCKVVFHVELGDARIAPDAEQVVLDNEHLYTVATAAFARRLIEYGEGSRADKSLRIAELAAMVESEPGLNCPRCGSWSGQTVRDVLKMHRGAQRASDIDKKHLSILPKGAAKKPVYCTLLIDTEWLKGSPGDVSGTALGGYSDAAVEATGQWYRERLKNLRLIEVRGRASGAMESDATTPEVGPEAQEPDLNEEPGLPSTIVLSDGRVIDTGRGTRGNNSNGTPLKSSFRCGVCGQTSDILDAVAAMNRREHLDEPELANDCESCRAVAADHHPLPVACYLLQCFDPARDAEGHPYGGRFFKLPTASDIDRLVCAEQDWDRLKNERLANYWPRQAIPHGLETHIRKPLGTWGYTHFYKMFLPRQLLIHSQILAAVARFDINKSSASDQVIGAVQQYLRSQNTFCIWNIQADKLEPFFSTSNYHPKQTFIESNFISKMGRGNWSSCSEGVVEGLEWARKPDDLMPPIGDRGSSRVIIGDAIDPEKVSLTCGSSTDLSGSHAPNSVDLVVSDPPFGYNIAYADMADYFYVWLRLLLRERYPEAFGPELTRKAQEAISNAAAHPDNRGSAERDEGMQSPADQVYQSLLTACWQQCHRVLKASGVLTFTFHHAEDDAWIQLLESLFDAGFILEATYPVSSDETKGEGSKPGTFGSQKIEYDIIHVSRKRLEEPKAVSWPKMRQWVKAELARLRPLLESYKSRGLQEADVRVILRGKALEFFSRHYGQVLVSAPGGESVSLSIREALLGINQLLDESSSQPGERPPSIVQPVVYQYLRLFGAKASLSRDEVSKLLRGTTIQQSAFEKTGSSPWIVEEDKAVTRVPIYERFQTMRLRSRRELKTELDQAHFLIGAGMSVKSGDIGTNIEKELERDTFLIRPGVEALLDWYSNTPAGSDEPEVPKAAGLAATLLRAALEAKRARMRQTDPMLWEEWEAADAAV